MSFKEVPLIQTNIITKKKLEGYHKISDIVIDGDTEW